MLVQNSVYRNTYLTDGVNKDFYFSFPILESSQVLVQTSLLTNTDVVTTIDPSQYTVTGVGLTTGGHISFTTAPPAGSRIALTLNIPITQLYQYAELDSFPAKSHEDALAKLTLICQQLKEQLERAVRLPPTSEETPQDVVQGVYAARDEAQAAQWEAHAAAQIAIGNASASPVLATNTTVARTLADRFAEVVNVKDFGAKGDGSTDDTTAFNNFLTHLTTNGGYGLVPVGTYAINPVTRDLTGGKSFTIRGADRVGSVLKNNIPDSSFIYLTGCSNCAIENLTVDGNYTDVPYGGSGAHIGLVNTNDFTLRDVLITRFRRIAVLAYNDHQTTTTNVYNRLILERVTVLGNSNYVNGVGPSALLVADYNNSVMRDCYIENIGMYGYEYKNDCSNTLIEGCVAVNVYNGIYYGGNGAHTELRYVKNSLATDCVLVDCTNPITTGKADNNVFSNIESRTTTSGPTPSRATISLEDSNDNRAFGIHISGRKKFACDIRKSTGNSVEFSLNDGEYTGEAVVIAAGASDNSVTIEWKNHDTKILNELRYPDQNQVVDVRAKYYHRTASETYPLIEDGLSPTRPPIYSTAMGRVQYGTTFDTHTITGQPSLYENVGDYTNIIRRRLRHKFDTGSQSETIYSADMLSSVAFVKEQDRFYPTPDNTIKLGAPGGRWAQLYAGTTTISTSDGREKQQVRELTDRERAVASHLKSLLRAFKFNDAVEKRGDAARLHFGIIAQDVKAAFEAEGLVAEDYALLCYDEWDEVPEERDENGLVVQQHIAAGNRYGVRYEELLAFIIAAL